MKNQTEKKRLDATTVAGALGAGLLGYGTAIHRFCNENLQHAMFTTVDSNMSAASDILKKTDVTMPDNLSSIIASSDGGKPHWSAIRKDIQDTNSIIGNAYNKAISSGTGKTAAQKAVDAEQAIKKFQTFMMQFEPQDIEASASLARQQDESIGKKNNAIKEGLSARRTVAKETNRAIPWANKLTMRDLHLTNGQKTQAAIAFAAVSGVSAFVLNKMQSSDISETDIAR